MRLFADRADAGRQLAAGLTEYAGQENVIVLALPRGGVPIGFEVAASLNAPLDVYVVRKLGVPGREELAMGAIAGDGTCVVDEQLVESLGVTPEELDAAVARESAEIARRERTYREARPAPELSGKTVIVVDDGLATGATMRAAAIALRRHNPAKLGSRGTRRGTAHLRELGARSGSSRLRLHARAVSCRGALLRELRSNRRRGSPAITRSSGSDKRSAPQCVVFKPP